jgi:hypothetical protein
VSRRAAIDTVRARRARNVAEVIQRVRPDVLPIDELDLPGRR